MVPTDVKRKDEARSPFLRWDEPKTDPPLYVVVPGIPRVASGFEWPEEICKAYLRFLMLLIF